MHFHGCHILNLRLVFTCYVLNREICVTEVRENEWVVEEGKKSDLSEEKVWPF